MTQPARRLAAASAVLLLLLTGCATSDDGVAPEPAATDAPAQETDATDGDATGEGSAGEGGEAEEGSAESPSGDEPAVDLPGSWPAEVPVIDGTVVDAFAVGNDPVSFWGARVVPAEPLETVHDAALALTESSGFELAGEGDNDLGTVNRHYQSAAFNVFINISTEPGEEGVLYNVQPR